MVTMTKQEREELAADIAAAVRLRVIEAGLSEEEMRWIRLSMKKQAQSIELRKAIIEKSLTSLVWMCILGVGSVFMSWATSHGYKP